MENPCSGDDDSVHNKLDSIALVDLQSRISGFGQPVSTQSCLYVILYKSGQREKSVNLLYH